jgi:hypothetical protein
MKVSLKIEKEEDLIMGTNNYLNNNNSGVGAN